MHICTGLDLNMGGQAMMYSLIIKIVILIGIGAPYHYSISSDRPFESLESCKKVGIETADWLRQDGMTVSWECHPAGG